MPHRLQKTLDLGAFGESFFVLFEHLLWPLLLLGARMCLGAPWGVPGGVSEELWGAPGRPGPPKVTSNGLTFDLCSLWAHTCSPTRSKGVALSVVLEPFGPASFILACFCLLLLALACFCWLLLRDIDTETDRQTDSQTD